MELELKVRHVGEQGVFVCLIDDLVQCSLNPSDSFHVLKGVVFHADAVSVRQDAGHSGRHHPAAEVEDHIIRLREVFDDVSKQTDWFLANIASSHRSSFGSALPFLARREIGKSPHVASTLSRSVLFEISLVEVHEAGHGAV